MRHISLSLLLLGLTLFAMPRPSFLAGDSKGRDAGSAVFRYPDFGFLPPAHQYEGRVFKLSQDYPARLPAPGEIPEICTKNFDRIKANWKQYLMDVRGYCFNGNIKGGDVEDDFRVENNKVNRWYHMPWQHYGPTGREGIHGLTKEAPVQPRQFAWTQTQTGGQACAVAFYNEFAGYTIGQVWQDHDNPGRGLKKIEFPVGSVVFKLLFVDVPPEQVAFLNPPLRWQAYITDTYDSNNRSIRHLSLIQADIMVRHQDAPCGWLFGTYQYNGARKAARHEKSLWNNLVPVGLQWGNDPDIKDNVANPQPVKTIINDKLRETVINPDTEELPPTHLGWNGRLNGPVDNPMSSCMSCHLTASSPQRIQMSPLFEEDTPPPGSDKWMHWFQNLRCGETFDKESLATDFSLQMAISLQNFRTWQHEGTNHKADAYKATQVPARIKKEKKPVHSNAEVEIHR